MSLFIVFIKEGANFKEDIINYFAKYFVVMTESSENFNEICIQNKNFSELCIKSDPVCLSR